MHYFENKDRYAAFEDKIKYCPVTHLEGKTAWEREFETRNYAGMNCLDPKIFDENDLIISTDVDELPKPDIIDWLAWNEGYRGVISFAMRWNHYGFMWWSQNNQWVASTVTTFWDMAQCKDSQGRPYALQTFRENKCSVGNERWMIGSTTHIAGWHCSWCFPTKLYLNHMDSFSRQEDNLEQYRDLQFIAEQKRKGVFFHLAHKRNLRFASPETDGGDFAPEALWELGDRATYLVDKNVTGN